MINLRQYLEKKICDIISTWSEDNIYAISFFVDYDECNEYGGYSNITEFYISYNTESDCEGDDEFSEKRWNYAYWRHNETPVIAADDENEGIKLLFDWYRENEIDNIGYEDDDCYDEDMEYTGKGPVGYYELLKEITSAARKIQESGFIKEKFGKNIPIIIHDLEYSWYVIGATKEANPNGEADVFLDAMKKLGFCS